MAPIFVNATTATTKNRNVMAAVPEMNSVKRSATDKQSKCESPVRRFQAWFPPCYHRQVLQFPYD